MRTILPVRLRAALCSLILLGAPAPAQTSSISAAADEFLDIYSEHPRLFLGPQRLRLLRRERDRRSIRWLQFETLMAGKAPMPEPGFAKALYYKVGGNEPAGREAVRWALGPGTDLRQLAIVFDWCQPLLTEAQSKALLAKLEKGIAAAERDKRIPAVRDRTLAAVVLAGHDNALSQRQLASIVRSWWRGEVVPALKSGRDVVPRDHDYALLELLHAVRDNLNIDLREPVPGYFKTLPLYHLLSYYPASYPAAENEYRIPAIKGGGQADVRKALMARASDLAMVAYETNAPETQILQGWLMHDHFLLRGTLGIPYEFLWANPYHPGLSYYHAPLLIHDELFGRLFIRSSWEEDATWLGYFDGQVQIFKDGHPTVLSTELLSTPLELSAALVYYGSSASKFQVTLPEDEMVFLVGLKPRQIYEIEVDDEEMREETTDGGGILPLKLPAKVPVGVRLREARRPGS